MSARRILFPSLVIAVLLGAGLAYLFTANLAWLEGPLTGAVEGATGRGLTVAGHFEARLGAAIEIVAFDVALANPPWADTPALLRADELRVRVPLGSLLRGPLVLDPVVVRGARVNLEETADGRRTWDFGDAAQEDAAPGDGVVLRTADLHDLRIELKTPRLASPLVARIERLGQSIDAEERLALRLDGAVNDAAVTATARAGPFAALLGGGAVHGSLAGQIGPASFSAAGETESLSALRRPALELEVAAPAAAEIAVLLGLPDPGPGALDVTLGVSSGPAGVELEAAFVAGALRLDASGQAADLQGLADAALSVSATGPDLAALGTLTGLRGLPPAPFRARAAVRRERGALIIEALEADYAGVRLDAAGRVQGFPALDGVSLDLALRGEDVARFRTLFGLPGAAEGPFTVSGQVSEDSVDLSLETGLLTAKLAGRIGAPPDYVGSDGELTVGGKRFGPLATVLGLPATLDGAFDGTARFALEAAGLRHTARLEVGGVRARSSGILGLAAPLAADTDVEFELGGDDASRLNAAAGLALPAAPWTATGRYRAEREGARLNGAVARLGEHRLTVDGRIGFTPLEAGTDLEFAFEGPDAAALAAMGSGALAARLPPGAYAAGGRVASADGMLRLGDVKGQLAGARFRVDGKLSARPDFVGSALNFDVSGPSLDAAVGRLAGFALPAAPFEVELGIERTAAGLSVPALRAKAAGTAIRAALDLGLPLSAATRGRFDVDAQGEDLARLLANFDAWQPPAAGFALRAAGRFGDRMLDIQTLRANLDEATLRASGVLDGRPGDGGAELMIAAEIPRLDGLGTIAGWRPPAVPLTLSARAGGALDDFALTALELGSGESAARGTASFRATGERPEITASLRAARLDIGPLLPAEDAPAPRAADGRAGRRLIPDTPLPLEALDAADVRFELDAELVEAGSRRFEAVHVDARLEDGRLRLVDSGWGAGRGSEALTANLAVEPGAASDGAAVSLVAEARGVAPVGLAATGAASAIPRLDGRVDLSGSGRTLRELAASLDGRVQLKSGEGRLPDARLLTLLLGDFLDELARNLSPFAERDPSIEVVCTALALEAVDGVLRAAPRFVGRTARLDLVVTGQVDLATERLDVHVQTRARKGLGLSAGQVLSPYLRVGGTLARPQLQLDPEGSLIAGGAAVATAGLSILARQVMDRAFADKDPCGTVIREAQARWSGAADR